MVVLKINPAVPQINDCFDENVQIHTTRRTRLKIYDDLHSPQNLHTYHFLTMAINTHYAWHLKDI